MTIEQIPTPAVLDAPANFDAIRSTALAMADAHSIATAIANTSIVPAHFRGKPDDLTAAILYGATLGFDPMQSARQIYVVHGQTALYARAMSSLVLSRGHDLWTVESTDDAVTVAGRRKGTHHEEVSTWTYARAEKAGYTKNDKYQTDPQGMLYAKAVSEVCRKIAPDVLNGVYAAEELQLEFVQGEVVSTRPTVAAPRGLASVLGGPMAAPASPPEPAASEPVEVVSEDTPTPMTKTQENQIGSLMKEAGITDRAGALLYVNDVLPEGREVTARTQLTFDEAVAVIAELKSDVDAVKAASVEGGQA